MPIPSSWQQQTDRLNRAAKAKSRAKARTTPLEKDIQKALRQAFKLNRVETAKTDAGGSCDRKGLMPVTQTWLKTLLGLPQVLPWGLEMWLHVPPDFSDLLGMEIGSQRVLFVEVKRQGEKPRPGQLAFLAARRAEGHVAFWASSVDDALSQFAEQMKGVAA